MHARLTYVSSHYQYQDMESNTWQYFSDCITPIVSAESWAVWVDGTKHYRGSNTAKNWQGPALVCAIAANKHKSTTHKQLLCNTPSTIPTHILNSVTHPHFEGNGGRQKIHMKQLPDSFSASQWAVKMCICAILANSSSLVMVENEWD